MARFVYQSIIKQVKKLHVRFSTSSIRLLFFENLFNEPADSRFPKIRIKIKIGFRVFLLAPIRNSSPHLFCVMRLQMAVNGRGKNVSGEV